MRESHGEGETEKTGLRRGATRMFKQPVGRQVTGTFCGGKLNGGGAGGENCTADPF